MSIHVEEPNLHPSNADGWSHKFPMQGSRSDSSPYNNFAMVMMMTMMKKNGHPLPLLLALVALTSCFMDNDGGVVVVMAQEVQSPGVNADAPAIQAIMFDDDDGDEVIDFDEDDDNSFTGYDQKHGGEQGDIAVDDYLVTLSVEELKKICWDRGFDVDDDPTDVDSSLTHDDYVNAARRCLSLEDEMNAILNEHPELAAELEKEIQRLQDHKMRLEQEQAVMLEEKAMLEAQLEQAGVDLEHFKAEYGGGGSLHNKSAVSPKKDLLEMSFPELLLESFRQLFDRVKQDVLFVIKVTRPVWQQAFEALKIGWRYSKPGVMQAFDEVRNRIKQILPETKGGGQQQQQQQQALS